MQFEKQERAQLLALLNGSERAVQRIEEAIGRYITMLPMALQATQKPSEAKKEADRLRQALQTLVGIIADGGEAWNNFRAYAADDGLAVPLHHLIEALGPGANESGEALARVAAQSAIEMTPSGGRRRGPEKAERFILLFHVSNAARDAGVLISRNSAAFRKITEAAFRAANVDSDPEHDIREYLKTLTE